MRILDGVLRSKRSFAGMLESVNKKMNISKNLLFSFLFSLCIPLFMGGCASRLSPDEKENYEFSLRVGVEMVEQNRYLQGKEAFERALAIDPSAYEPKLRLGWVFYLMQDYELARTWFEKVCAENATQSNCAHALASTYLELKNYPMSERWLDRAIQLGYEPMTPEIFYLRSKLMLMQKRNYESKKLVNQGLNSNPGSCQLLLLKVEVLAADRAYEDALLQTKEMTNVCPGLYGGHLWEAWLYMQTRQKDLAQRKLKKIRDAFAGTPAEVYSREALRNIEQGVPLSSPAQIR